MNKALSNAAQIDRTTLQAAYLIIIATIILSGCAPHQYIPLHFPKNLGVHYQVSLPDPEDEEFQVHATITGIEHDTINFYFPIWAPGAYDIVNFGRFVHDIEAFTADGQELQVTQLDTNTFQIIGAKNQVAISYRVHDIEQLPNSLWFSLSDIEPDFAFAVGAALFGYPDSYKDVPYTVTYSPPADWNTAISLDTADIASTFYAKNYDELVDAPVMMGKLQQLQFTVQNKPHYIAIHSPEDIPDSTMQKISFRTSQIIEIMADFFDELPYQRYLFQHFFFDRNDKKYGPFSGALEHANSSTYLTAYSSSMNIDYGLVPIIAHEFWHLWSPKRFHVHQLGPFDYQHPPRTTSLWFAEGLTEYYARILIVRNRITEKDDFLSDMEMDIQANYGKHQHKSIAELSQNISEATPWQAMQLYSKGSVLGLLLDAEIRLQSNNHASLDDAMRFFNNEYGKKGITFSDDEIITIMERATNTQLQEFYRKYITGVEKLPIDEYLPKVGLRYTFTEEMQPSFGAELEGKPLRIKSLVAGGTAESLGIKVGDTINRLRTTISNGVGTAIINMKDGREVTATLLKSPVRIYTLTVDSSATGLALEIRKGIMGF